MRIAIATDEGQVSPHFGRCQAYTMVDVVDGSVTDRKLVANPGHAPGAIPEFLHGQEVETIVCGGIGARATGLFDAFGIEIVAGVDGSTDAVIEKITKGELTGGEIMCKPGDGYGFGLEKTACDHESDTE